MIRRVVVFLSLFLFVYLYCLGINIDRCDKDDIFGIVIDSSTGESLPYSNVLLFKDGNFIVGTISDADGGFSFKNINIKGSGYRLKVSFVGYQIYNTAIDNAIGKKLIIKLTPELFSISEVLVTAAEKKGLTSTSEINRDAMEHLQPSSFSDLLSLLPGGMSSTPDMSGANTVKLREVGISDADYQTTSLGTKFLLDGASLQTDANMQYLPDTYQGDADYSRRHVSAGVDMRTIPTDNIAKVEIVRGIPSVKYGDLTSGLIKIIRKNDKTPVEARFKADMYGKLISVGKGFGFRNPNTKLNIDGGFFSSRIDPRDPFKTYRRINLSARFMQSWHMADCGIVKWNINTDYAGNVDNVKYDPEIQKTQDDRYKSSYHSFRIFNSICLSNDESRILRNFSITSNIGISRDQIDQSRLVSLDRDAVVPVSDEPGVHDGIFLPYKYVAWQTVNGKPFYSTTQIDADIAFNTGIVSHVLSAGGEWQYNKNLGNGYEYDIRRPMYGGSSHRPRAYKDIPSTSILSFYLQEKAELDFRNNHFTIMAGVRGTGMMNLTSDYVMHGKVYLDPRVNMQWNFPDWNGFRLSVSGGIGSMSKMPTIEILYPDKLYSDLTQFSYWHPNPEYKRVNLRTYIINRNNYDVEPARNLKWEARISMEYKKHLLYITYFREVMNNGFRSTTHVMPFGFRKYDGSGIDGSHLTGPPSLDNLPSEDKTVLRTYSMTQNGSRTYKEGVEFQYSSPRFSVINTRLTVNGAWFYDIYENSKPEFQTVGAVVGNVAVSDMYVGLYDWKDSYIRQQITSNFIVDTYIEKLGLIFSATAECYWWGRYDSPATDGRPIAYMATDGKIYSYTVEDERDPYKQKLNLTKNRSSDISDNKRFYMCTNFKASKKFGRYLMLSFFADRILNYAPDYEVNGFVIRRHFSPYFGMELNIKI